LVKFRYEKEIEIWDLKKHLVKLQQIEIRKAEAKATLAELMLNSQVITAICWRLLLISQIWTVSLMNFGVCVSMPL
jgi:hypothetical protein